MRTKVVLRSERALWSEHS